MFSKLTGRRLPALSDGGVSLDEILRGGVRGKPDVAALATLDKNRLAVFAWHYHDDDVPGPDAEVALALAGLPRASGEARLAHWRIDETHSNAFTAWKRLGSPQSPTDEQYTQLEKAGRLTELHPPKPVLIEDSAATVKFMLPRQAVSLLELTW
jgi:xylan 1,4-beta-xylosidase